MQTMKYPLLALLFFSLASSPARAEEATARFICGWSVEPLKLFGRDVRNVDGVPLKGIVLTVDVTDPDDPSSTKIGLYPIGDPSEIFLNVVRPFDFSVWKDFSISAGDDQWLSFTQMALDPHVQNVDSELIGLTYGATSAGGDPEDPISLRTILKIHVAYRHHSSGVLVWRWNDVDPKTAYIEQEYTINNGTSVTEAPILCSRVLDD